MAIPAYYPACELLLFLVLLPHAAAGEAVIRLSAFASFFAYLTPVALLAGPTLFNPYCFQLVPVEVAGRRIGVTMDLIDWFRWVVTSANMPTPQEVARGAPHGRLEANHGWCAALTCKGYKFTGRARGGVNTTH